MTATRAQRTAGIGPALPRLLVVAVLAAIVTMGPWAASPAHAAEITFDDPDGVQPVGEAGRYLPTSPGARSDYAFSGSAEVEPEVEGFVVEVVATREDTGEEFTLCTTPQYDEPTDSWLCHYVPLNSGPLPTAYDLQARLIPLGADEPAQVAPLSGVNILSPPELDEDSTSTETSSVTLRGTRATGFTVEVFQGGVRAEPSPEDLLCTDEPSDGREWSCTFDLPDDTVGTHEISARQVRSVMPGPNGVVASSLRSTVVERMPGPEPEPEPTPGPEPEPTPGPEPTAAPEPTADRGPAEDEPAPPLAAASPAPVDPPADGPPAPPDEDTDVPPVPTDGDDGRGSGASGGGEEPEAARAEAAGSDRSASGGRPSSYGTGLRPLSDVLDLPVGVALAGAGAAISFLLFVALPAELLYSTLRENYARAFAWPAPLRRIRARLPAVLERPRPPWLGPLLVLVTAAGLGALAEPDPGGPVVFLRIFLAVLLSLVVLNGAGALVSAWVGSRRYGVPARLVLMPGFLLIAALSVLASRQLGLQPGILFGLLVSVAFGAGLRREQAGRVSASVCAVYLGLGVLAWLLHGTIGTEDTSFTGELLREVLTTVTIGTIGSIVIALLPLTFLEGRKVLTWSRPVWALLYALTLVLFVLVVVPLPDSWVDASRQSIIYSGTFGAFGVVSLTVWAWFRLRSGTPASVRQP
ncbi:hypothetical protein ACHAAC_00825 [Aeromicrobium sp. CF4.19]|uniref:hypothetical protein n=1 Tax=Aeromicrobium sp. CF4.19 TaxID=3373082 RepID=UPI003EE7B80F